MTSSWAWLALIILSFGCNREPLPPAERLLDTWRPEIGTSLQLNPETKALSPLGRAKVRKLAGGFLESIRYEFTADGRLHREIGDEKETHAYRITAHQPHGLELEVDDGQTPRQASVVFHDDLLFWKRGGQTMVFEED
jgi:hypothetical protein